MVQSGIFSGRLLGPLSKTGLSLIENVFKPLPKSVLMPLGFTAAASATVAAINKKIFKSEFTALIIFNNKMEEIVKIVKFLEDSGLVRKGEGETIKGEAKEQKVYLWMLLGTLGARLIGNLLTGKGTIRAGEGTYRTGKKF